MKSKALKRLFAKVAFNQRLWLPYCNASSEYFAFPYLMLERRFANRDEAGECLRIRGVRKWRREISHIAFIGGSVVVSKRGRKFRVYLPGRKADIRMHADGPLMRRGFHLSLPGGIEMWTRQEKGFWRMCPGTGFEVRFGEAILHGVINSDTGDLGQLQSNRFKQVDFQNDQVIGAHFGDSAIFGIAVALLLWIGRGLTG